MSVDLQRRITDSLEAWAAQVVVEPPPTWVVEAPLTAIRRRRPLRLALAGLVPLVAAAIIVYLLQPAGGSRLHVVSGGRPNLTGATALTPGGEGAAPARLGDPAEVVLANPDWHLSYFLAAPANPSDGAAAAAHTEYQWDSSSGGHVQLSFYPPSSRVATPAPTPSAGSSVGGVVTVRGAQGTITDEGAPRWRIDWDEAGKQWEADGSPFASAKDFAAFVAQVQIVDEATWQAHMPPGIVKALQANPNTDMTWYPGHELACYPPDYQPGQSPPACSG